MRLRILVSIIMACTVFQSFGADKKSGKSKRQASSHQYEVLKKIGDVSNIPDVDRDKLICFCMYTARDGVLKMTAHLYPVKDDESKKVILEVSADGSEWKKAAETDIHPVGWTALFRVEGWDSSKDMQYRVSHASGSVYSGIIRHDPVEKDTIVVAAFTGNSPGPGGGKISKRDVVDNILKVDPDVMFFTGDQVYPHTTHTAEWLDFGRKFGDIIKDRPTICLPDDHDVGQPNLWGGGGRKCNIDTEGGYTRPVEYVKMVERQQTSHMPDPYDPTPIEQGIGVYYSSLNIGGVDFAWVEDRKFKSGCKDFDLVGKKLGPRPDHIDQDGYDPKSFDRPDKKFLGDRQLKFLEDWAGKWKGVVMKSVVSQTAFSMASTHHGAGRTFYYVDFDAGGWPQTGRNKAVDCMRKCFAFHICGDQHLSTMGQYGIEEFRDANLWFCVPSIANLYPRWWAPKWDAVKKIEDSPLDYTGDYFDGMKNRMTIYAHTNPYKTGKQPAELLDRMPGFGVIKFKKSDRTIRIECWPRMTDPTGPDSDQYKGWPRTISQFDNYDRKAMAWLPKIVLKGEPDQVVEVIAEESGTRVYIVRIKGDEFTPRVFAEGEYTVKVGEGSDVQVYKGLKAEKDSSKVKELVVKQ